MAATIYLMGVIIRLDRFSDSDFPAFLTIIGKQIFLKKINQIRVLFPYIINKHPNV